MAPSVTGPLRLLVGDQELSVPDGAAVEALVRAGRVDAHTRVSLPGERRWRALGTVPAFAPLFSADPWAAWDAMDEDTAEKAREAFDPPEIAPAALEPLDPPTAPSRPPAPAVEELPPAAIEEVVELLPPPRPAPPRRVEAAPRPAAAGRVIAFPQGRGDAPVDGTAALDPFDAGPVVEAPPAPARALRPPARSPVREDAPPRPMVRWWVLMAAVLCGGAVAAAVRVVVGGTAHFVQPPAPEPVELAPVGVESAPPVADPYRLLEDELRVQLRTEPLHIAGPGDFEDALTIELRRVHVDLTRVEAPIRVWGGKKQDVPQVAEVVLAFTSRPGELDRELAGIALVVGRYVAQHGMEVPRFDVYVEGVSAEPRRIAMNAESAQRFFLQRITLTQLLAELAAPQGG